MNNRFIILAAFMVAMSISNGFGIGIGRLHSSNKPQYSRSRLVTTTPIKTCNQGNAFATTSPLFSSCSLIAYDTAYTDTGESLRGKLMDHKYGKYIMGYDFEANELYYALGFLVVYVVFLRAVGFGDGILTFFGLKKKSEEDLDSKINRVWNRFTGAVKTEEQMKKQLTDGLTENDIKLKPPPTETFECEKCRMQLMPAKGRAIIIMSKPTFRCARCGSKASAYFDIHDMSDERAVNRKKRLEDEKLGK